VGFRECFFGMEVTEFGPAVGVLVVRDLTVGLLVEGFEVGVEVGDL
jgi:hypothetical protein